VVSGIGRGPDGAERGSRRDGSEHAPTFGEIAAALDVKPGAKTPTSAPTRQLHVQTGGAVGPKAGLGGRRRQIGATSATPRWRRAVVNVEVVEGKVDDPLLPEGVLDAVLVVDAYHEMEEHAAMLRHMRDALKPGGRLVIVEHMPGPALRSKPRIEQQDKHALSPSFVEADLAEAGFEALKTTVADGSDHGGVHDMAGGAARTQPQRQLMSLGSWTGDLSGGDGLRDRPRTEIAVAVRLFRWFKALNASAIASTHRLSPIWNVLSLHSRSEIVARAGVARDECAVDCRTARRS
jgi:SAM-dependent methyltransferase